MKKTKIVLVCLLVIAIICGSLYFVRINRIDKEQQNITICLKDCLSYIKDGDQQNAVLLYNKAVSLYEQSAYKETLTDVKEALDATKEMLDTMSTAITDENK